MKLRKMKLRKPIKMIKGYLGNIKAKNEGIKQDVDLMYKPKFNVIKIWNLLRYKIIILKEFE